jgi:hypothetical protein
VQLKEDVLKKIVQGGREIYYVIKTQQEEEQKKPKPQQEEEQNKLKPQQEEEQNKLKPLPSALSNPTHCQKGLQCKIMGGSLSKSRRKMRQSKRRKSKRRNTMNKK